MIKSFRELTVYQKAIEQAVRIFEVTKRFPKEEQYSLVLPAAITVTYRRSPGPPLGRLVPRRCRLALTPGWSARGADLRAGDGLARGRGVSGRPGRPGRIRPTYTSSICVRVYLGTRRVDSWIRRDRQDARIDDLGPREVLLQRSKGRFMRLPAGRCQLPSASSQLTFHGDTHCTSRLPQTA